MSIRSSSPSSRQSRRHAGLDPDGAAPAASGDLSTDQECSMKPKLSIGIGVSAAMLALPAACQAGDVYGEASAAYKNEIKRDEQPLINTGFLGDIASSQAKRVAANAAEAQDGDGIRFSRNVAGRGVNIASPQIFGTVRGDVTIITGRGMPRGSITSVRR
jgi:hypothetical protein